MILFGELEPGQKLKIDRLRSVLDTGASPIREALSLLTSVQLVERHDQRGFRASGTSQENFLEILTLRCALEEMALRGSIANATDEWEEKLVLNHHRMGRDSNRNLETFEDRHKAFHMSLLANCQSPILLKFCSQLNDLNIRYRCLAQRSLNYQERDMAAEHAAIFYATIQHNADLASKRLRNHYRKTGAFLNGMFSGPPPGRNFPAVSLTAPETDRRRISSHLRDRER